MVADVLGFGQGVCCREDENKMGVRLPMYPSVNWL